MLGDFIKQNMLMHMTSEGASILQKKFLCSLEVVFDCGKTVVRKMGVVEGVSAIFPDIPPTREDMAGNNNNRSGKQTKVFLDHIPKT